MANNRFNLSQRFVTVMCFGASHLAQTAPIPFRRLSVCWADALRAHKKMLDNAYAELLYYA